MLVKTVLACSASLLYAFGQTRKTGPLPGVCHMQGDCGIVGLLTCTCTPCGGFASTCNDTGAPGACLRTLVNHYSHEVDSTNTWAKRLAEEGAPNGTLTTAETQTAGKGRRGRVWKSPEGTSVSMSLLLYPDLEPAKAPMLTIVMGLAVVQGVQRALGVDTRIKWPNDAVLNGKKLCGILTEMSAQIDYINYVVIGTGINVNQMEFPEDIAEIATSLAIETGHPVNRAKVVAAVLEAFEEDYEKFLEAGDLSGLKEAYEAVLANKDQPVRVLDPKEPFEGVALGITPTGELRVQKEDGTIAEVHSGEVSVRGLYSYV